jgi:hypothetical protein
MRWCFLLVLITLPKAHASQSKLYELFRDEVAHLEQKHLRPQAPLAVLGSILQRYKIDVERLSRRLQLKDVVLLPRLEERAVHGIGTLPITLHAVSMKAHEISDDWMQDDVFCYFFVTDGAVPYAKVTSVYRGLSRGESFHFTPRDKVIFPIDAGFRIPQSNLIIDYGIVEVDGDDNAQLRQLAQSVMDLALAIYAAQDPRLGSILLNLRAEIHALTRALLELEHDDRLVTGSLSWDTKWQERLQLKRVVPVRHLHHSRDFWDSWKYELNWRWMRE